MKILHLTLKKQWFDLIYSGEKKEEYRDIKRYWDVRLSKAYDAILFSNGYGKKAPKLLVEFKRLSIGFGKIKHGAPPVEAVYILKLGKILETHNIKLS